MFDRTLTAVELENFIEARAIGDTTAPVEHRVRSYLDTNCSHCHRPGGTIDFFDATLGTPLISQGLVNGMLKGHFDLGPNARYLKPGDPSLSALHFRMNNVGNGAAMPPLAKNLVDQDAVDLLQQYITNLNPAEFETTASPQARYVRLTALTEVIGRAWTSLCEFSVLDGTGQPIPTAELSIHDFDSEELVNQLAPATNAIDGDISTIWHTEWGGPDPVPPHHLTIDLGSLRPVGGFVYTPRQTNSNGRIGNYQVHHSVDGVNWTLMTAGPWPNDTTVQRFDGLIGKRKARCEIAGPTGIVGGAFDVTVAFDTDVADFTAADLQVTGGSVSKLRGEGYYYVATVFPTSGNVTVSVPADVANSAELGSRASAVLSVDYQDALPPVPVFTGAPAQVAGPFQIGLTFGERVNGLTVADFLLVNATLDSLVPAGDNYLLNLTPQVQGSMAIEILNGAVTDNAGIPMGAGTSLSILYLPQILARNASEASYIGGGMLLETDAAAPHGQYLSLPDAAYPNNFNLPVKTQHRAEFTFVVPQSGQWLLRGLIHSADASSDSFFTEIDGNQALGSVNVWDTAPVGTTYAWDYMNNRNVADPVIMNLTAGNHTVTVYGRDDGTKLDRLELESVRPLATLTTTEGVVDGWFTASLAFSESVTGLTTGDFAITGGSVVSLTGSGSAYLLTIAPDAGSVVLSLPQNSVLDAGGAGNFASNPLAVTHRRFYQQWAFDHGVSGTEATQLSDEDGDGISKLLEFAFNLDPASSDHSFYNPAVQPAAGLPRMIVSPSHQLSLQYLQRKSVAGLSYQAQFGSSPGGFVNATGMPLIETINTEWERVTVDDPAGAGPVRRFGRVVVTLAPP